MVEGEPLATHVGSVAVYCSGDAGRESVGSGVSLTFGPVTHTCLTSHSVAPGTGVTPVTQPHALRATLGAFNAPRVALRGVSENR